MKNLFIFSVINCMAFGVYAADVEFNGALDSFCTINVNEQGGIFFTNGGRNLTSDGADARATVINNDPGQYLLSVLTPTDFSISPTSYDNANLNFDLNLMIPSSEPNSGSGQQVALANQGTDEVYVQLTGDNGEVPFSAGIYQVTSILSCEAGQMMM